MNHSVSVFGRQSYLDIRVFNQKEAELSELGTAYLHLTSMQPGISRQNQEVVGQVFRGEVAISGVANQFVPVSRWLSFRSLVLLRVRLQCSSFSRYTLWMI